MFGGGLFYVYNLTFVGVLCLENYLKEAQKKIQGNQRNPIQCQKEEVEEFQFYKQVQILGIIYNERNQTVMIPTTIMATWFVMMICLYTCVKLHEVIDMPGFAFFPTILFDGLTSICNEEGSRCPSGVEEMH